MMEEIINSVMQSPENTNPNVLRSQLQSVGGGSGSGGALVVNATVDFTTNKATCDKTAGEMWSAAENGDIIVIHFTLAQDGSSTAVSGVAQATFEYYAEEDATPYYAFALAPHPFKTNSSAWRFSADSASDYPEASMM